MDLIPNIVNAVAVTAVILAVGWMLKGKSEALERRMDRHEAQNEARFEAMQASIDDLRSDLTQLAISLGNRPRAENA